MSCILSSHSIGTSQIVSPRAASILITISKSLLQLIQLLEAVDDRSLIELDNVIVKRIIKNRGTLLKIQKLTCIFGLLGIYQFAFLPVIFVGMTIVLMYCISKYCQKRHQSKKDIFEQGQANGDKVQSQAEGNCLLENLTVQNLNILHNNSQAAILDLDAQLHYFNKNKESIHQLNRRLIRDMTPSGPDTDSAEIIELVKQITIELSRHRDVEEYILRAQDYMRNKGASQNVIGQVQRYLAKVDDIFSEQGEQYIDISHLSDQDEDQGYSKEKAQVLAKYIQ